MPDESESNAAKQESGKGWKSELTGGYTLRELVVPFGIPTAIFALIVTVWLVGR
jgi:hypothetical protein